MPIIETEFPDYNLPLGERCYYCGRKATRLCDTNVGIKFDAPNEKGIKTPVQKLLCSIPMCDKCTFRYGDLDFCKEHRKELKQKLLKEGD